MGVKGLTTYINLKQDTFLKQFLLHDTCVVIDGHSLCAQLYRSLRCFSAFGGDYDKFAAYVKNFFKNLRKCNITAYVLFDGSYEHRKLKTAHSRLRSKIYGAAKLDPVTQDSLQIFPYLLRDVFKEALTEMNIPYTICEFEADDEIAAMARRLNCPVLSYDSDFFIYNVLYIPFNTLNMKPVPIDENDKRIYALECKIYRVENLTRHFGGLQQDMLPLLATLLGNDYVKRRVFSKFFSQLKMPKSKVKKNEQQKCIHGLFQWLQNETLDTAISKILGRLKKNYKDKVRAILKKSIKGYNCTQCRSLKYFNICNQVIEPENAELPLAVDILDVDPAGILANDCVHSAGMPGTDFVEPAYLPDIDNEVPAEINDNCSNDDEELSGNDVQSEEENYSDDETILGMPEWVVEGIRHKHIPQSYINLYTHHLHFCSPQAEDYSDKDSFLCALPILRYAFDILTDYSEDYLTYVSRENDLNYHRIFVDKECAVSRPMELSYSELTEDQKKSYFYHFLNEKLPLFDLLLIDSLPSNFQLFMVSVLWWVAHCEVPLSHVHSLFVCYIMLEVIDEKTGTFRGHFLFNNKYSKKIEELKARPPVLNNVEEELFLNKNKVQYEDSLIAASVLLKLFDLDDKIQKKPKTYDARKIHSFAQFQCCLQQLNSLNILCGNPLESTKYSKCYNGTFIYNVALKLEKQIDPVAFLEQYLKGATTVLMFYKSLCKVYERCVEKMGLVTNKWMGKKSRRKQNAKTDDEINFIVKGFESEVVI